MYNSKIPNRTQLLVKSDKLRKSIKSFCEEKILDLSNLDRGILKEKIKRDGSSIVTNLLGYNRFEQNQYEFAFTFVWNIELTDDLNFNSIEIIVLNAKTWTHFSN
jgi:hypothetical protein